MHNEIEKTYVWSFLGRISHWLLVLSFFLCYYTSFYENKLQLHVSIGIIVFGMLLLKIVWGVIGPKYARWSDFKFSIRDLKNYFIVKINNRYRKIQAGHNPASSWFAFLVTWVGIVCCISGFLLYGIQEEKGIFSFLNKNYSSYIFLLENIHIVLVYILIVMIATHILGVLIEQFYHKTNMVMAMVSGYKRSSGENIKTTFMMRLLASLYIVIVLCLSFYSYYIKDNIFVHAQYTKIDYKSENEDFFYECSDCHNLYPPFLLTSTSWIKLLEEQHNHYDEDLELDKSLVENIKNYMVTNSADNSTKEVALKIKNNIKKDNTYTITKTNYWKNTHINISNKIFNSAKVEKKSNCVSCHQDFEQGILSDSKIKDF